MNNCGDTNADAAAADDDDDDNADDDDAAADDAAADNDDADDADAATDDAAADDDAADDAADTGSDDNTRVRLLCKNVGEGALRVIEVEELWRGRATALLLLMILSSCSVLIDGGTATGT